MHTIQRQLKDLEAAFASRIDIQERRYKKMIATYDDLTSGAAKQKRNELLAEADGMSRAYRNAQLLVIEFIRLSEWTNEERG
jgi:hypothetical protein